MKLKTCFITLLLATLTMVVQGGSNHHNYCEDWTLCQRVRCAPPPNPCPKDKPYLLYGECGCCQFCSDTPRLGPCGEPCQPCKEEYPICSDDQIVSLDYWGCCRVCKSVVGIGSKCVTKGPSYSVCAAGLKCLNGTCVEPVIDN